MGYFLRRCRQGLVVVFGVVVVVFVVTRLITDPVRVMLPLGASEAQYAALEQALGLDQPLLGQFVSFVGDLVTLDFGESLFTRGPAADVVVQRLPATFLLVGASMPIAVAIGLPLGVGASVRPNGWLDRVLTSASLLGLSLPQFWLGAMLILLFAVTLGWLPTSGQGGWRHLLLPGLTLGLPIAGRLALMTRSAMVEQLALPYVATLRSRGLSELHIVLRHAARNALVPVLTLASWEASYALAGYAVIVETVFAWPGIGLLAIQAIRMQDVILLQAVVFVAAVIVTIMNIVTDYVYTLIDPRIRLE